MADDENGGRALDTALQADFEVGENLRGELMVRQRTLEFRNVQVEVGRIAQQITVGQRILAGKRRILQLPELALGVSRLGRCLGIGMDLDEREVTKSIAQSITQSVAQVLDDRVGHPAKRTLIIAVFDPGHRGSRRDHRAHPGSASMGTLAILGMATCLAR